MENLEVRYITELRANTEDNIVRGTAIVFNSESVDMGFREVIKPEAATEEFLNTQDIVMLYNHNQDSGVLARSKNGKGSLKFNVDERGVNFEFKAKKKDAGIVESIAAGDLDACSFAFRIADGGEQWEKRNDGTYLRTISKFDAVQDFSVVVFPAYAATSINTRGLDELKQAEELKLQKEKEDREKDEVLNKEKEISNYYKNFEDIIQQLQK
jgi:HK97 family phage prohead protease